MAEPTKRQRGRVEKLPSGSLRVSVYAGQDPVTKRRHYLREVVPAGPKAAREAQRVLRRLVSQVDDQQSPRTAATVDQMLDKYFSVIDLDAGTVANYVGYADRHIRPLVGQVKVGTLDGDVFDSFYAELRRCRTHCDHRPRTDHRTPRQHECDHRCRDHVCRPLAPSTVRQIHFILSGALRRAVRWRWIMVNPIEAAEPPSAPKPNPSPPSPAEVGRILEEAWKDPDWGLLVWLVVVTGLRRGEVCSIRWRDLDLERGVLMLARSIAEHGGRRWEKDTKSHQHRRLALDDESVQLLSQHHDSCRARAKALGLELPNDAYVFSAAPDGSRHLLPGSVTQRYSKLAARLGITTSLHKLRHYSATELIAGGVDIRTVAGRLGHGGGGTTTLRVYTAWVAESDQRASATLFDRMPERAPVAVRAQRPTTDPVHPYEVVAHALADGVAAGAYAPGSLLPSMKDLSARLDVSVSTVQRAAKLLERWGVVQVVSGRGCRVLG